jgi:hypothetical protein
MVPGTCSAANLVVSDFIQLPHIPSYFGLHRNVYDAIKLEYVPSNGT